MQADAVIMFSIEPSAFWRLTITEFERLRTAARRRDEQVDRRVARVLAMIYNVNRSKGKRAATEADFMPRVIERQSPDDMLRAVRDWHRLLA